jgi:hypothetical protein
MAGMKKGLDGPAFIFLYKTSHEKSAHASALSILLMML